MPIKARVIADYGADYLVTDEPSARRVAARHCDPVVGDWVDVDGDLITEVLPRRTAFSRRAAGIETRKQVLASNVDVAFVVAAAIDVNVRRLERYLTIAWQSGAGPVVVITKADL
ncbi:MAG TPA: GTPase RsgA, partial [Candidatus Dormibacteraeota bacterium]|nr:GTPase RsgA [Candidatus Dormibacteraeota bacterium]